MEIKYVTMSGCNESTDIEGLVALLHRYPFAEIGIQVNEKKCAGGSSRRGWIYALASYLKYKEQVINAALHVNPDWVTEFCQGSMPHGLQDLLDLHNYYGCPFFQRVQLNFRIGRDPMPDADKLMALIHNFSSRRFILSFNESNAQFIRELYRRGAKFDLLFDSSHGEGIAPKERPASVYNDVLQGYAGGISPENVAEVLDGIAEKATLVPNFVGVAIDAEGKLKEQGAFSIDRGRAYLSAAEKWMKEHA